MATNYQFPGARLAIPPAVSRGVRNFWFLAVAVLVFAGPGLLGLANQVWTTEQGSQGPIILATGLWLLVREIREVRARPERGNDVVAGATLFGAALAYVFGHVAGMLWLEWFASYVALVAIFYAYAGRRMTRLLWFPLLYLAMLTPLPYSVITPATRALKLWISAAAVDVLSVLGFQVANSGTTLYIDQYELLVAAACSGMNSIMSLLAIGLFYIFLRHRADWRYAIVLALLVLPVAILANLIRVVILLLITHYLGDAAAQGLLHEAAGMVMFFVALLTLIAIDGLLSPVRRQLARRRTA